MVTISEALKSRIQHRDAEQPATPIRGLQKPDSRILSGDSKKKKPAAAKAVPGQHLEFKRRLSEAVKNRIASRAAEEPTVAIKGL